MLVCAAVSGGATNDMLHNPFWTFGQFLSFLKYINVVFTETRLKTRDILLDIDFADILAARLEKAYKLQDSFEGDEEEEDDDNGPPNLGLSHRTTLFDNLLDFNLSDISKKLVSSIETWKMARSPISRHSRKIQLIYLRTTPTLPCTTDTGVLARCFTSWFPCVSTEVVRACGYSGRRAFNNYSLPRSVCVPLSNFSLFRSILDHEVEELDFNPSLVLLTRYRMTMDCSSSLTLVSMRDRMVWR